MVASSDSVFCHDGGVLFCFFVELELGVDIFLGSGIMVLLSE